MPLMMLVALSMAFFMAFSQVPQVGSHLCSILPFCKWKALTAMQRLLPVMPADRTSDFS